MRGSGKQVTFKNQEISFGAEKEEVVNIPLTDLDEAGMLSERELTMGSADEGGVYSGGEDTSLNRAGIARKKKKKKKRMISSSPTTNTSPARGSEGNVKQVDVRNSITEEDEEPNVRR